MADKRIYELEEQAVYAVSLNLLVKKDDTSQDERAKADVIYKKIDQLSTQSDIQSSSLRADFGNEEENSTIWNNLVNLRYDYPFRLDELSGDYSYKDYPIHAQGSEDSKITAESLIQSITTTIIKTLQNSAGDDLIEIEIHKVGYIVTVQVEFLKYENTSVQAYESGSEFILQSDLLPDCEVGEVEIFGVDGSRIDQKVRITTDGKIYVKCYDTSYNTIDGLNAYGKLSFSYTTTL